MTRNRKRSAGHRAMGRRGFLLVCVMVCLAVAMGLTLSWLKIAGVERRQVKALQQSVQAEWLAESGFHRAAARLAADTNYAGETWQIGASELDGADAGEVVIRIEAVSGQPNNRQIHVQADYPIDPQRRHRRSKDILINLTALGGSS